MPPTWERARIANRHPDWVGDAPDFDAHYQVVASESFAMAGTSPGDKYLGPRSPRVCAFCDRSPPVVTFRKVAHALLAALGNRHVLSNEECDECNDLYSRADNELANMLEPHRMVSRGRRRRKDSAPKYDGENGESVTWDPETGGMSIVVSDRASSKLARFDDLEKRIDITVTRPAYKPLEGIRSLLRSAWMITDAAFRARHPDILQLIRVGVPPPARYIELSLAGNQPRVGRLVVYEKTGTVAGADVILAFTFGNFTIIFAVPTRDGQYGPSLLPQLEVLTGDNIEVGEGRLVTVTDEDSRPAAPFSFSLAVGDAGEREPNSVLAIEHGEATVALRTYGTITYRRSGMKYALSGGEFAGKMTITMPAALAGIKNAVIDRNHFTTNFSAVGVSEVRRTLEFFRLSGIRDAVVRVTIDGHPRFVGRISKPTTLDLTSVYELVECLAVINDELRMDLRVPAKIEESYIDAARLLAEAIRVGRVPKENVRLTINVTDAAEAVSIRTEVQKDFVTVQVPLKLQLTDPPLDVGDVTIEMIRPRIVEQVISRSPEFKANLIVIAEKAFYVFHRWQRSPA